MKRAMGEQAATSAPSPPARGAWIETWSAPTAPPKALCRPLRGGRGLKHPEVCAVIDAATSPPARGAWIETTVAVAAVPRA